MKKSVILFLSIVLLGLATACVPVVEMPESVGVATGGATPTSEPSATSVATAVSILPTRTTTPPASLNATAVPSPTPSATLPFDGAVLYPADTRTGHETIDRVLEIVLNGSAEELRNLFGFTTRACTHELGLGGPPQCREGESEGTPVEVLFIPGIEGSYARREDFQAHFGLEAAGVVAIYHAAAISETENGYDIIFLAGQHRSLVLKVDQRGIVNFYFFDEGDAYDEAMTARLDLANWTYLGESDFAVDPDYVAENSLAARLTSGSAEIILPPLANH